MSDTNPFRSHMAQRSKSPEATNPFRESSEVSEPPSYVESEGARRGSEPYPDEKSKMEDERYREGYEEGMRIARERERQRRERERERRRLARERSEQRGEPREHRSGEHRSGESRGEHRSGESREHRSDRERRSGDRERHSGDRKDRHRSRTTRDKSKPNGSLDVIDKLDATGLYGGSGFHHDGPFDACAPHRNKGSKKRTLPAPIAAFPADGPNNSLAVEDPALVAYRKDEAVFGRDIVDLDLPPEALQNSFDPTERGAKVHGERTYGLGSTTFIDGTPASKDAIAQANREAIIGGGAIGRSRSMRRPGNPNDDMGEPKSLLSRVRSLRVGRH